MKKKFCLQNQSCNPRQNTFQPFFHPPTPGLIYGIYFNVTPWKLEKIESK